MCGITGQFIKTLRADFEYRIQASVNLLRHRGPNDSGHALFFLSQGGVSLGHTRLSIIDLSQAGHQPMSSADERYVLVFNGEIYNYKELRGNLETLGYEFTSDSDTEVLLQSWVHWGADSIPRFRGMFAFVIYDKQLGTLTCVRDGFGIKPLYYCCTQDGFAFSSEISALHKLLPETPPLNLQNVYEYLENGRYDEGGGTFFQGVMELEPGHVLTQDLSGGGGPSIVRWWWPSIAERNDLSFPDAVLQLRRMFLDNVRLHLRSDVAVGAALSGGVDSSSVVCAMRHLEPDMPIHTFSYVARGSALDEERWVDLVNQRVGGIPHKVLIAPDDLAKDVDRLILAQGEPFGGTSIYAQYRVFRDASEQGVIVTLDGQGADELLAGYDGYPAQRLRSLLETGQFRRAFFFLRAWAGASDRSMLYATRSAFFSMLPRWLQLGIKMGLRRHRANWLNRPWLARRGVHLHTNPRARESNDAVGRRVAAALRNTLTGHGLNSLLRHGDRNSMHWSVESRVPFLTTDMAEFLLSLPESYLISSAGETKHIFREAMRGIVPDEVLDRRDKIGFATPELEWLRGSKTDALKWLQAAESIPFLNATECRRDVEAMLNGVKPFTLKAWRLINFCRWTQLVHSADGVVIP
jgi:asparagine synthase (glutamine-hydrolysing)